MLLYTRWLEDNKMLACTLARYCVSVVLWVFGSSDGGGSSARFGLYSLVYIFCTKYWNTHISRCGQITGAKWWLELAEVRMYNTILCWDRARYRSNDDKIRLPDTSITDYFLYNSTLIVVYRSDMYLCALTGAVVRKFRCARTWSGANNCNILYLVFPCEHFMH